MKKVSVVIQDKNRKFALQALRNAGVLHLEKIPAGSGAELEDFVKRYNRVEKALGFLDSSVKKQVIKDDFDRHLVWQEVDEILEIETRMKTLHAKRVELALQGEILQPFGDFEPAELDILRSKGVDLRLVKGRQAFAAELQASGAKVFVVGKKKKDLTLAVVYHGRAPESLVSSAIVLPELALFELNNDLREIDAELALGRQRLVVLSRNRARIEEFLVLLGQDIEFEALATGMDRDEYLGWLTGFIPEKMIASLEKIAKKEAWALLIRDPHPDDFVPTLIVNNPIVRLAQPIFSFLNTVPGYREWDISGYFLVYFSLFFAMIIGDALYGALFFLGAFVGHIKIKVKKKSAPLPDIVKLLYLLGFTTMAWGALTGNWVASPFLASLPFLHDMTIPHIAVYPGLFPGLEIDPQRTVMWFCFFLGLSQLSLANFMNIIRYFPRLKALAHLGWMGIIVGLYFLVLTLVISEPFPSFALSIIIGGFVFVVFFAEQERGRNFFKGLARGFGGLFTTFLDLIGGFSNIISYIRLFAVGMSSFYIASSFNNLAAPLLHGWFLPLGIAVLVMGHGLNLMMALLSVIVHGVRLNMLEFSSQLGMEWVGIKYDPFRVKSPQKVF